VTTHGLDPLTPGDRGSGAFREGVGQRDPSGWQRGGRFPRYAVVAVAVLAIVAALGWRLTSPAGVRWSPAEHGAAATGSPLATVSPPGVSPSPTSPPLRRTPVKVAIFGDSQGTALYVTRPRTVSRYLQLSDQSISACGILRGRVVSRSGERFDLIGACPNWLPKWRADAKRIKPDIALVMIGAWDVFDLKTKDTTLIFGSAEWDAAFMATLRSGLSAIRESGAQIALAELPCYRPHKTNPRPPGWWPERGDDDRTAHVNELLRQVADGVHIFTVAPAAAFCTDRTIGDNPKYRYDGVHYLQPGAKVYLDAIIPQLLRLPS
jgi:GDSL-like Lipase/Acylhydrolase family